MTLHTNLNAMNGCVECLENSFSAWRVAYHNVGDERVQKRISARASLAADACQLHDLIARAASQKHPQPIKKGEGLTGWPCHEVLPDT
jgi:hypothetical protein